MLLVQGCFFNHRQWEGGSATNRRSPEGFSYKETGFGGYRIHLFWFHVKDFGDMYLNFGPTYLNFGAICLNLILYERVLKDFR